eukprot:3238313-Heterocapsa_arctica.AAC.1
MGEDARLDHAVPIYLNDPETDTEHDAEYFERKADEDVDIDLVYLQLQSDNVIVQQDDSPARRAEVKEMLLRASAKRDQEEYWDAEPDNEAAGPPPGKGRSASSTSPRTDWFAGPMNMFDYDPDATEVTTAWHQNTRLR